MKCGKCSNDVGTRIHDATCNINEIQVTLHSALNPFWFFRQIDGFFTCPCCRGKDDNADRYAHHLTECTPTSESNSPETTYQDSVIMTPTRINASLLPTPTLTQRGFQRGPRPPNPPRYPSLTPLNASKSAPSLRSQFNSANSTPTTSRATTPGASTPLKRPAEEELPQGPARPYHNLNILVVYAFLQALQAGTICGPCVVNRDFAEALTHPTGSCHHVDSDSGCWSWRKGEQHGVPFTSGVGICFSCGLDKRIYISPTQPLHNAVFGSNCEWVDTSLPTVFAAGRNTEFLQYLSNSMGEETMDFDTFDRFVKGSDRTASDGKVNPTFYVLHEICRFYEQDANTAGVDLPLFSSYEFQSGATLQLPALIRTSDANVFVSGR